MSFVWPPNGNFAYVVPSGSVNIFDTLEISYTSTWSALNFTLFCQIGDVSSDYGVWQAPGNPMAASGTYRLNSIFTAGFDIVKFPTKCAFRMTQYGNSEVYNAGQFFQVVSQPGVSTTYQPTSTPAPTSTSNSAQSSKNTSSSTSTPVAQSTSSISLSSSPTAKVTVVSSSAASSTTTTTPVARQAVLSPGIAAGIGIGSILLFVLILVLSCLVVKRRRVRRSMPEEQVDLQTESPMYVDRQGYKSETVYDQHELEQTSLVELPSQQRTFLQRELE